MGVIRSRIESSDALSDAIGRQMRFREGLVVERETKAEVTPDTLESVLAQRMVYYDSLLFDDEREAAAIRYSELQLVHNTNSMLSYYFGVSALEFWLFWEELTEEEKRYYRSASLSES